jgi:hypothetical protein
VLAAAFPQGRFGEIRVDVPRSVVLTTEVFEKFLSRNGLHDPSVWEHEPDDRIGHAFQAGDLPTEVVGDLQALVAEVRSPLAVRSSSLLEDALHHPFAGVYETKMIPNDPPDPAERFRKLAEAVKFVYASTYSAGARRYLRAAGREPGEEKMAVILQEVVGLAHGERFYPNVSGVARSYNFYPHAGARRDEGVVNLALGLGKTIVDGGVSWPYSPARPQAPPPFVSLADRVDASQARFWAIRMGKPPEYDPLAETEYLVEADLDAAEYDGTLPLTASTYLPDSDRLVPGVGRPGIRVLDFAPLLDLRVHPLNDLVVKLLEIFPAATGGPVEIEFALTLPQPSHPAPPRLGFLQVRPMKVAGGAVEVTEEDLRRAEAMVVSDRVMGNGECSDIRDVVFVVRSTFDLKHSREIAAEITGMNRALVEEGRPYLLIGFGRWGSSDPWLGIPVRWDQISGAKVIVEASLERVHTDLSQGAHFFQNITGFEVYYFDLSLEASSRIPWDRLETLPAVRATRFVRHVRFPEALRVKADGRSGRGGIWLPAPVGRAE